MSSVEINTATPIEPQAIYLPYVTAQENDTFEATWAGKDESLLLPTPSGEVQLQNPADAPYCISQETVTTANQNQYPEYEHGENIATILVSRDNEICVSSPVFQVAVGSQDTTTGGTENSVNPSWFTHGTFDSGAFTRNVIEPALEALEELPEHLNTTVTFTDLPQGLNGYGYRSSDLTACQETNNVAMFIDNDHIINPESPDWQTLSERDKGQHDLRIISTVSHERSHVNLFGLGIPPRIVGEEAIAAAVADETYQELQHLWHNNEGEQIVRQNNAYAFYWHSSLRMDNRETDEKYKGYEHSMLISWLLDLYNEDTNWLIQELDRVTHEEQELGCPVVPMINVLPRIFNHADWDTIQGHYLGHILQASGSEFGDIFDEVRSERENHMSQVSYFSPISLEAQGFEYINYIHLQSTDDQRPVVVADKPVVVAVLDEVGRTVVLRNNADLSPYIKQTGNGSVIEMAVLNIGKEAVDARIEPRILKELWLPSTKQ